MSEILSPMPMTMPPSSTDAPPYFCNLFDRTNFYILQLGGDLPAEVPLDIVNKISSCIIYPKNVLINCFCLGSITTDWLRVFNSLYFQLLVNNKKVGFIFVPPSIKKFLDAPNFRRLKVHESIRGFLEDFIPKESPMSCNFIKAFIYSTVKTIFIQAFTPSLRKGIYYEEDNHGELKGDVNGFVQVMGDKFFYIVAISFPEPTFLKIISSMLGEEIIQVEEVVRDGAAEIVNIIFGQAKKIVNKGKFKISSTSPKTVVGKSLQGEVFYFGGKDYPLFQGGLNVVIPFSSMRGDFFVEIWFPKEFSQMVQDTIK